MKLLLLLALLAPAARAADVPFYLRTIETQKDVAALNENFRSLVNDITKLRADVDALGSGTSSVSSSTGTPKYIAVWISSETASSSFAVNLSTPFANGTITYMNGTSFPATAKVMYHASLLGSTEPGSHAGVSNPFITVAPETQGLTANNTFNITVVNNVSTGYTARGMIIFVGYDP